MGKALEGIRVIDMTHDQAGPSCTQMLAWLGAEVIKVEMADGKGDRARWLRRVDADKDSFFFLLLNSNKKSTTLDLRNPKAIELFKTLVKDADILAENRGPGAMDRLGLGYDDLKEINPRLIYASVKGFGSSPSPLGANVGDSGTGMHTVIGILAALVQRGVTGHGQMVEVAMQEAVLNLTRVRFTGTLSDGAPEPRQEFSSSAYTGGLGGLVACAPGGMNDYVYMMIPADNPGMFTAAMRAMGREDLIENPRYASPEERQNNSEELSQIIRDWTGTRDKREVMAAFAGEGVPCGAVFDTSEVIKQPHLIERGMISEVDHPVRGKYPVIGCPVRLSDSQVEINRAPMYSEHSDEIFTTLGGLTQAEVDQLRRENVIV